MSEWIDPRYEDAVVVMRWAQESQPPSRQGPLTLRGFVVAEPDED